MALSLADLFEKHPGVVFGDDHDNPAITRYLAGQMGALAKAGVTLLFVEMFQNKPPHRTMLDAFNGRQQTGEDKEQMHNWLERIEKQYPTRTADDYLALFEAARDHGIRIVGMEPEHRHSMRPIASSNDTWHQTIISTMETHRKAHPDDKYAVFGGRLHTQEGNQLSGDHECDQATGIDKRLGIPCVTFPVSEYAKSAEDRLVAADAMNIRVFLANEIKTPLVPSHIRS